jgi:hypothetical protein
MFPDLEHRRFPVAGNCLSESHFAQSYPVTSIKSYQCSRMEHLSLLTEPGCTDSVPKGSISLNSKFFSYPLILFGMHSVDIRKCVLPEESKRLFSTQNDRNSRPLYKRRARGAHVGIPELRMQRALHPGCPPDRKPGPGLLAFSRSPVSGPLFYKRKINPQNGGHA